MGSSSPSTIRRGCLQCIGAKDGLDRAFRGSAGSGRLGRSRFCRRSAWRLLFYDVLPVELAWLVVLAVLREDRRVTRINIANRAPIPDAVKKPGLPQTRTGLMYSSPRKLPKCSATITFTALLRVCGGRARAAVIGHRRGHLEGGYHTPGYGSVRAANVRGDGQRSHHRCALGRTLKRIGISSPYQTPPSVINVDTIVLLLSQRSRVLAGGMTSNSSNRCSMVRGR